MYCLSEDRPLNGMTKDREHTFLTSYQTLSNHPVGGQAHYICSCGIFYFNTAPFVCLLDGEIIVLAWEQLLLSSYYATCEKISVSFLVTDTGSFLDTLQSIIMSETKI